MRKLPALLLPKNVGMDCRDRSVPCRVASEASHRAHDLRRLEPLTVICIDERQGDPAIAADEVGRWDRKYPACSIFFRQGMAELLVERTQYGWQFKGQPISCCHPRTVVKQNWERQIAAVGKPSRRR